MTVELKHAAELKAAEAQNLDAFGGLNLRHIKGEVYELLRHIGEQGIFETYTRHDSAHIEAMLAMVDWVIPQDTAELLTPADWLMIVLSIYLHDLGMLVTKDEFGNRNSTAYLEYRRDKLESLDNEGQDYVGKVNQLPEDERERFLYQEFVRRHHATRIRIWIDGSTSSKFGAADATAKEIAKLLEPVGGVFRADLGLVCESHHENDLDNLDKYPIRRHYGTMPAEAANLQYAAIILRTVDLLQVTRDRTPSIAFRVLNPADPLSQVEWAKQMAVRAITEKPKRDRDGNVDHSLQADTIEVHAHFDQENGFFALTSYLSYAREQLEQTYRWALESRKRHGSRYGFPWRDIDETPITTKDFLPHQYEFDIDQARVLDLLTGHTLYNDSSVVLRELTQNAVDAVRLQNSGPEGEPSANHLGVVKVRWDSTRRVLEVEDHGTGMTQQMIEDNFLKVGSSRYRDDEFVKRYPRFHAISRFGIGVLSTFMLADSVEVVTSHPDEAQARRISLRSVHGKYLIRLLDKDTHVPPSIREHGTIVRLTIRASASLNDVIDLARSWFVVPRCKLTVQVDDGDEICIGYPSLKEALENVVNDHHKVSSKDDVIEVREFEADGIHLAYAVRWSPYFQQWAFVQAPYLPGADDGLSKQLGTCIEGVRVKEGTPGFDVAAFYAIANAGGVDAPRTNVARSNIDDTPEYTRMLEKIAEGFLQHVSTEVSLMTSERGLSPTRAALEGRYMCDVLLQGFKQEPRLPGFSMSFTPPRVPAPFRRAAKLAHVFVTESRGERRVVSLQDLDSLDSLWTVDEPALRKSEDLIRQLPLNTSLAALSEIVPSLDLELPSGTLLVGSRDRNVGRLFEEHWEPAALDLTIRDSPRLQIEWRKTTGNPIWRRAEVDTREANALESMSRMLSSRSLARVVFFPLRELAIEGLDEYDAFSRDDVIHLLPNRAWVKLAGVDTLEELLHVPTKTASFVARFASNVFFRKSVFQTESPGQTNRLLRTLLDGIDLATHISPADLTKAINASSWRIFDGSRWEERDASW